MLDRAPRGAEPRVVVAQRQLDVPAQQAIDTELRRDVPELGLAVVRERVGDRIGAGRHVMQKAAEVLINDFRSANLGRVTLETPVEYEAWLAAGQAADAERAERKAQRSKQRRPDGR